MNAYAPQAYLKPVKPCGCKDPCGGDCGCESRCCDLECLVRPRFFCGQLLTDADLTATVEWARSRFSLSRYRHGWGIVCGLDVTCNLEDGHCCGSGADAYSTVYVHPGYAIDCCGNDLVVCEPMAVDLSEVCRRFEHPCEDLGEKDESKESPEQSVTQTTASNGKDAIGKGKDAAGKAKDAAGKDTNAQQDEAGDCWAELRNELVAVDLWLRYREDLSHGQRAMFHGGCCSEDIGACEHSRVLESPCVYAELVGKPRCWEDRKATEWEEDFKRRRARVLRELADLRTKDIESVLRYLKGRVAYRFCFVEEYVCCLGRKNEPAPADWNRIVFWLYLDWLLHELDCQCWSCRPDPGVPLARVLMRREERAGKIKCRVIAIDTGVAYRRLLRKETCRPLAIGAIDLAPYLWQPVDYAVRQLEQLGVKLTTGGQDVLTAQGAMQMDQWLLAWSAAEGRSLQVITAKDLMECDRVAAFLPASP